MNFLGNIKANYDGSELIAQNANYSNSKGFLTITENVKIKDIRGTIVADKLLFEPNNVATRSSFINQVTPLLATILSQQGIESFKVVMDDTNNTVEDVENNRLNGRIVVVPTRAIEFIAIDFIITNSGVDFA